VAGRHQLSHDSPLPPLRAAWGLLTSKVSASAATAAGRLYRTIAVLHDHEAVGAGQHLVEIVGGQKDRVPDRCNATICPST
jgi:hypothetical protein